MVKKVMANITNKRQSKTILLRREQAGFRFNKSCVDQFNSLRIIVEQSAECRPPFYLVFVDFEKVFDTLTHAAIWSALACKGVPAKILNLIKTIYINATCLILHENQEREARASK